MKRSVRVAAVILVLALVGVLGAVASSRSSQAPAPVLQKMQWSPDSRAACIVALHGLGAPGGVRISVSVSYLDESNRLAMEQFDKDAALVGGESLQGRAGAWTFEIPSPPTGWLAIESSQDFVIHCAPH